MGIRHLQVVLLFFAMVISYAMRVNMSLAIVAMTDNNDPNHFKWNIQTQGVILSAFFWGYIILQIPGGELTSRVGGAIPVLIHMTVNCIVSMLIPVAAYKGGWKSVCACRVIQGLAQGLLFPSAHSILAKWIPMEEKSRFGSIVYAGTTLGIALQLMASGYISDSWGWPAIFYIDGGLTGIWVVFYIFLGAGSPEKSKFISDAEKMYIQTSLGQVDKPKRLKTPWSKIGKSLPFFALGVIHTGQNWGMWTLLTEIPSYMKLVLNVDIKSNGVMSALPYLAHYVLSFPFGFLSDYFLNKKWCTVTTARKFCTSIGTFGPALALIGMCYVPPGSVSIAVGVLTVVVGLNAGVLAGFLLVHIDMSPNFAGILMAITNFAANFTGIAAPLAAGAMLKDETNPQHWHQVFYVASAIYIGVNIFFLAFGSSKKQPWNEGVEAQPAPGSGTAKA